MDRIRLKPGEDRRLRAGHLWVFSNEIAKIEGAPAPGAVAELFSAEGTSLGVGFYNPRSLIALRLLAREPRDIDQAFFAERIRAAAAYRAAVYPGLEAVRVVFGESDGLPGLIIDRYGKYFAVQFLSAGMDLRRGEIVAALRDSFEVAGVIARNDSALRPLEGLERTVEVLWGDIPPSIEVEEFGCRYAVDLAGGQKTGFFLDQKENRRAFSAHAAGRRVLDCFCHTGGFGIAAARAGAAAVTWVDSSRPAVDAALENARLNGIAVPHEGIAADAEEYLSSLERGAFDLISIDPPALIKSRKFLPQGFKAYKRLNAVALGALKHGGLLASSSCSHHLSPADFRRMLEEAAAKSGRQVRLLETRLQPKDHPILLSMPETEYLKFAVVQVV